MKRCTRFHFLDVERGDRIFLGDGFYPGVDVVVVVDSRFMTYNFGPVIRATDGNDYYLDDYDTVREAAPEEGQS